MYSCKVGAWKSFSKNTSIVAALVQMAKEMTIALAEGAAAPVSGMKKLQ